MFIVLVRYSFSVDLQNTCSVPVTVQATVTAQTSGGTETSGQVSRTIAAGTTTRITGTYPRFLDWNAYPTSITVTYTVGGVTASQSFSPPWSCTAGPAGAQATQSRSSERMPSDEEIRAHPEWDPRTSAGAEQTATPEPASAPTTQSVAPEQSTVDAEQPSGDTGQTSGDSGPAAES